MKLSTEVSGAKLRGGFYSTDALVDLCLSRIQELAGGRSALRVLEPSAGDGAFIRGIARHGLRAQIGTIDGVELLEEESAKARDALGNSNISGTIHTSSFLAKEVEHLGGYDVAVGNPPYLRFQFITPDDVAGIRQIEHRTGTAIGKVSNLWIPIFLSALLRLRDGGAFSFILPSEFLTGISARVVREWLTLNSAELQIEIFPPKSFPGVLQEVIVLSGRVARPELAGLELTVRDHVIERTHVHRLDLSLATWTAFTIAPNDLDAFRLARSLADVHELNSVARISVSTVTGANSFFTFDDETRANSELGAWSRPLISRSRQIAGLEVTDADWDSRRLRGEVAWLLDATIPPEEVDLHEGLRAYLERGVSEEIPLRYKCRVRSPWYKVPTVRAKSLLMSKRSHQFPRLIANTARVLSTDTIYQGEMNANFVGTEDGFVAAFHNSLTLLSAEIEGRSFGGGVLELVPSEIGRLLVFDPRVAHVDLKLMDSIARSDGYESEKLVAATNAAVSDEVPGLSPEILSALESARQLLLDRRLSRN